MILLILFVDIFEPYPPDWSLIDIYTIVKDLQNYVDIETN